MLASGTGAQGQRGEDEEMMGDAGAWGEPLAGVDKRSTGWRARGGRAICHDPHSHSLMAVNSRAHWKPSGVGGGSGQSGTPRVCTPRPGLAGRWGGE